MPKPMTTGMSRRLARSLAVASAVSLLAIAADRVVPVLLGEAAPPQVRASRNMVRAIDVIREHREHSGPPIDPSLDPNRTGLIGEETSEITTTLGDLEAKRTTTNPQVAALLARLLEQAGVRRGDRVAVGCSGSFPALFVAFLAAAEALEIEPVITISLGASSYGANRLDFTLVDLSLLLNEREVLRHQVAAASLGGSGDRGLEFEPGVRSALMEKIRSAGIRLLGSASLAESVAERLAIYGADSGLSAVKAFVNIGGSAADMGTHPWILGLEAGLHRSIPVPKAVEDRGVILTMAEHNVPVIHLLHVKGLAKRYDLPWDPVPFGGGAHEDLGTGFWIVLVLYGIGLGLAFSLSHARGVARESSPGSTGTHADPHRG